jgi:hypothetical protein
VAAAYFKTYGQRDHEAILLKAASADGDNRASRLVAYSAAVCRRDVSQALDVAREALALGPDPVGSLSRWVDKLSRLADGDPG